MTMPVISIASRQPTPQWNCSFLMFFLCRGLVIRIPFWSRQLKEELFSRPPLRSLRLFFYLVLNWCRGFFVSETYSSSIALVRLESLGFNTTHSPDCVWYGLDNLLCLPHPSPLLHCISACPFLVVRIYITPGFSAG